MTIIFPLIALLVVCSAASLGFIWLAQQSQAGKSHSASGGQEQGVVELPAAQFEQYKTWAQATMLVGVGTGLVLVLALAATKSAWRRETKRRLAALDAACRQQSIAMAALENQLEESRRTEQQHHAVQNEAQKSLASLKSENASLLEELNKLKKAERSLSQERQVLESSKTVLEMHVQARTKELQKLQRRYEHILNSAGEGICGMDAEGRATFVNPAVAKLTGWSLEELVGKPAGEIFGRATDNEGLKDGHQAGEGLFNRKDGSTFHAEFVRTVMTDNGRVVGQVLLFKDITERKRVEKALAQKAEELARSNAELEQFAFVASHDLQEPLRKIQAFGDRLKTKCEGAVSADARDYLERMQNAASRMRNLIDDLLAFSRAIRSNEPFVPVNLAVVTKEVLGDLEVAVERCHAKVEVGDLPTIEADPMQMRQLLLNLVGNALKFQPREAQPVVKITARTLTSNDLGPLPVPLCELSVQDNGIGFEEKYLEKIFAVFQRLHGRNEYEGSGIGLAVCRRITDRHHGIITARSEPGKGANFIVTLPIRQPKATTSA